MLKKAKKYVFGFCLMFLISTSFACSDSETINSNDDNIINQDLNLGNIVDPQPNPKFPYSDQENSGNWILNREISDEFNGSTLNEDKWHIQGKNGEYVSNFNGKAPSQFSINNVRVEGGLLNLETRWEPDYDFNPTHDFHGIMYENITTAAIIAKTEFVYGYVEIRAKAADTEISSAFWGTGGLTEFDFFEFFGDHKEPQKLWKDREFWWSIHDWSSRGQGRSTYTEHHDLVYRVADDFHIYGYDWSENGIKIFIDGELYRDVTREEINNYDDVLNLNGGNGDYENFVVTNPIRIWLSQAAFKWYGVPDNLADLETNSPEDENEDGIVDFEIDYIRIWQKE